MHDMHMHMLYTALASVLFPRCWGLMQPVAPNLQFSVPIFTLPWEVLSSGNLEGRNK